MPNFFVAWLRRYADAKLSADNALLTARNAELEARQVTLFGTIRDWWRKKLGGYADRALRQEILQLKANLQAMQSRCDTQYREIVNLDNQLRTSNLDVIRAARGQGVSRIYEVPMTKADLLIDPAVAAGTTYATPVQPRHP